MKASVALFVFLAVPAASAQEVQVSGHAGWGGHVVRGEWTPVTIDLENRDPKDHEVVVALAWGFTGISQGASKPALASLAGRAGPAHQLPTAMAAGTRKRFSLAIVAPDREGMSLWAYALTPKGKVLDAKEFLVRARTDGRRLVAVVGVDKPAGLEAPAFDVAWIQPDSLPEDWRAFGCLDALVWLDGAANEVRAPAQLDAVRAWVSAGGHLVVARANDIGLARTPLADVLPVTLRGTKEIILSAIPGTDATKTVVLDSAVRRGAVRWAQGELPLRIDAPYDAGRVTFLAFNPARPPLAGSNAAPRLFWESILGPPAPQAPDPNSMEARMRPPRLLGSTLFAQQAGTFPNVTPPAIGGLFVIILIYLAVVGPGDYIGLRLLRRLELTWITFPAYVAGFTALILVLGGAFMRTSTHVRETAVEDHFLDSEFFRHRSVAALLAPSDTTYRFGDAEPLATNFVTRSFHEDTSGELTRVTVLHGRTNEVRDLALDRGATGLAVADRCGTGPAPLRFTVGSIHSPSAVLTIKNGTGKEFTSALLVTPRGVYRVGTIPPGDRRVEAALAYVTYREFVSAEGSGAEAPQRPQYFHYERGQESITEEQLNDQVTRTFYGLCFPAATNPNAEERTGFARSLDARAWVDSGGSVLLAWARSSDDRFDFSPRASQRTTLVLSRFFKGP